MDLHAQDIQFVIGAEGKPTAVLVDITFWEHILEALEDAQDVGLAKETLAALDAAGGDVGKAGLIEWQTARAKLDNFSA
jgi:hypothetical protein